MTGDRSGRQLSLTTRRELIRAIAERYHAALRPAKKEILDEFIKVTGYHRKHAIRALKRTAGARPEAAPRSRLYNEAVRSALTILWEAADRICGKRLKEAIPTLLDAMERYRHLQLEAEVRRRLLVMSAATMDRVLKPIRAAGKQRRRRSGINLAKGGRDSHIPTAPATRADGRVENQKQVFHFPTAPIPSLSNQEIQQRAGYRPPPERRSAPPHPATSTNSVTFSREATRPGDLIVAEQQGDNTIPRP